jgi:hypothetical protein
MKKHCLKCEQKVEPVLETYNSQFEVKNKIYKYRAYRSYCPECNNLIEKVPVQDIESRDKAFRKAEGLITTSQINDIFNKYEIEESQLSSMLGWDMSKLEKYIMGDIPTRNDSDILFKILEDEEYTGNLMK